MKNYLSSILTALLFSSCGQSTKEDSSNIQSSLSSRTACSAFSSISIKELKVPYCVTYPVGYDAQKKTSYPIIMAFHGYDNSQYLWRDSREPRAIDLESQFQKFQAIVVTPSFGPVWLLKDSPITNEKYKAPALMPIIRDEFYTFIKNGIPHSGKMALVGLSMGGYNAALMYLKNPFQFDAYVLLSPALSTLTPSSNLYYDVPAYVYRTGAFIKHAVILQQTAQVVFNDLGDFADHNPFGLAQTIPSTVKMPPLLVQVGMKDSFGFHEGNEMFVDILNNKKVDVTFEWIAGGDEVDHVVSNPKSVVSFLQKHLK